MSGERRLRAEGHIYAPVEIEREIARLLEACDLVITKIAERARAAAEADATYKEKHAKAFLLAEGSVAVREALATVDTATEYRDRKIAEALLLAAQEAGRNYRSQLDALRSLNTNVRPQAGLNG